MYLKVPNKYKKMVVSIQKIDDDGDIKYELNLQDGYGIYGSEEDSGMIYYDSYREMREEMKFIRRITKR